MQKRNSKKKRMQIKPTELISRNIRAIHKNSRTIFVVIAVPHWGISLGIYPSPGAVEKQPSDFQILFEQPVLQQVPLTISIPISL